MREESGKAEATQSSDRVEILTWTDWKSDLPENMICFSSVLIL